MKKLVISLAGGILLSGFAVTSSVSAEAEYNIQKGDTVSEIAETYGTTTEDIKELNNLSSSVIITGDKLKIDNERVLEVQKGDTLSELARDLDVDVNDIKEWNKLKSNTILIGQELKLNLPIDSLKNFDEFVAERNGGQAPVQKQDSNREKNVKQTSNESAEKEPKQAAKQTKEEQPVQQTNNTEDAAETLTVKATAYTADCAGCSGITATGLNLNENPNMKVIAVDPNVIPLGTKVWVEGYGEAIAGDTGGAINGNRIDIHVPTKQEAYEWGVRTVEVKILD